MRGTGEPCTSILGDNELKILLWIQSDNSYNNQEYKSRHMQ